MAEGIVTRVGHKISQCLSKGTAPMFSVQRSNMERKGVTLSLLCV